jgi:hypothetical protein
MFRAELLDADQNRIADLPVLSSAPYRVSKSDCFCDSSRARAEFR